MDNGELFKRPFRITPVESGGFVVGRYDVNSDRDLPVAAFTNLNDLMRFLQQQAEPMLQAKGCDRLDDKKTNLDDIERDAKSRRQMTASELRQWQGDN